MKYFAAGQLNTDDGVIDVYEPGKNDFAKQSACGIPDSAFGNSKVAIHPYFLKFAGLDRKPHSQVLIIKRIIILSISKTNTTERLLHARCLHLLLEGRRLLGHDGQSD